MTANELVAVLSSLPKDMWDAPVWIQNGPVFTPVRALVVVPPSEEHENGRVSLVTGWVVSPSRRESTPGEPPHTAQDGMPPAGEGGGG